MLIVFFFVFKQKTAYEMRISDWSSDVCSSDLIQVGFFLLDDEPLSIGGIRIEELDDVWPRVAREPIDEVDWRYRVERADWAAHHAPDDPFSQLGGRIDPMTCELP